MGQPKRMSWAETIISTLIGYLVALATQLTVFPLMGISVTISENLLIGVIFTIVSIIRGYFVRRLFNWLHLRGWR